MKLFRVSWQICRQGIRGWRTDYKLWVILILLAIFVHAGTKEMSAFADMTGYPVAPWIFPFLMSDEWVRAFLFFGFVMIVCNAPFLNSSAYYQFIRSGRTGYYLGQALYIVVLAGAVTLYMALLGPLMNLHHLDWNLDWGKVLGTLMSTNAVQALGFKESITFYSYFIHYFTPLEAMGHSMLLCWLGLSMLGLVVYAGNMIGRRWGLGMLAGGAMILWYMLLEMLTYLWEKKLLWLSPLFWTDMTMLGRDQSRPVPSMAYGYCGLIVVSAAMLVIILIRSRKSMIDRDEQG